MLFEFVYSIDESVVSSEWWDDNRRYLKAGTVEMIMSLFIRGWENHSIDTFVDHFADYVGSDHIGHEYLENIKERLTEIVDPKRNPKFLYVNSTSRYDCPSELDEELLPLSQRIRFDLHECMGPNAPAKQAQFGPSGIAFVPNPRTPLFQKHAKLRSWRLWNHVLFVAPPLNQRPTTDFTCPSTEKDVTDFRRSPRSNHQPVNKFLSDSDFSLEEEKEIVVEKASPATESIAFPWIDGTKGPIVPHSFESPGCIKLNSFAYPSSSVTSQRYVAYRSKSARPRSHIHQFNTLSNWKDRIAHLLETKNSGSVWSDHFLHGGILYSILLSCKL